MLCLMYVCVYAYVIDSAKYLIYPAYMCMCLCAAVHYTVKYMMCVGGEVSTVHKPVCVLESCMCQ